MTNIATIGDRRVIRGLMAGDVASVQAIDAEAHGEAWSQPVFHDEVARADRTHLVADFDGEIVGHASAWLDGSSCRITNVAVATVHRGNGHAAALLASLLQVCLEDHHIINLQLEVRPANRRAQRLYTRFGFVSVGIESDFYDRCDGSWRARLDQLVQECTTEAHDAGAPA